MAITWNHRIVRFEDEGVNIDDNGRAIPCDWYQIQEVHYKNGVPVGYCNFSVGSETVEGLQELVDRLLKASALPVLNASDFPDNEEA
jgi:hypothetical protein